MKPFKVFWNSSMHGERTPMGIVCAFYVINDKSLSEVFRNRNRDHAEDRVMKNIQSLLPFFTGSTLSIEVFQSFSPCQRCSSRYLQLLDHARKNHVTLKLTIVFAGFYKVLRPSCQRKGCTHKVSMETHLQQLQGLKQLRSCGVELRCFDFEDWDLVARHLEEPGMTRNKYRGSKRAEEDANMETDLQELGLQTSSLEQQHAELREKMKSLIRLFTEMFGKDVAASLGLT